MRDEKRGVGMFDVRRNVSLVAAFGYQRLRRQVLNFIHFLPVLHNIPPSGTPKNNFGHRRTPAIDYYPSENMVDKVLAQLSSRT